MPGISQRRFYSTIRGPGAEALETLAPVSQELLARWNRDGLALGFPTHELLDRELMDLGRASELLRKCKYASFRQATQNYGAKLAERGVRLEHAVLGLNRLYEICLAELSKGLPKRARPVLALARLHALMSLLIVSGFTGQWVSGKKTLVEASLEEDEGRRHEASAYVTRIYEQERRRLSQDLHDEIGHDLILIKLYLEMISIGNDDIEAARARVTEAIALVSHSIDAVRRLVLDLGPAIFEDLGFLPAVRSYVSQFSARTKINVTFRPGFLPEGIPMTHQVALYRLLQGALSNVMKHAAAKNVKVSLGSMKGAVLIMVIEDDGVGFEAEAKRGSRSFGLTAMRERVEVLGGKIHVQSRPATASKTHGTRIEVDLPLPGSQE
jgi:signal transduction histidine kinase